MTQLQITEFGVGLVYGSVGYLRHGFCAYGMLYFITMMAFFVNFYLRAYVLPRTPRKAP